MKKYKNVIGTNKFFVLNSKKEKKKLKVNYDGLKINFELIFISNFK